MSKNKLFVVLLVVVTAMSLVGLTGLFALPGGSSSQEPREAKGVPCLTSEIFHIHPHLTILVDGKEEPVPANIGILPGCTREIHTHAADGVIHIEAAADRGYTFADFLTVWGQSLERPGYRWELTVNGQTTTNLNFLLRDGQQIELKYIKS
jgi:hypothetical protein